MKYFLFILLTSCASQPIIVRDCKSINSEPVDGLMVCKKL
jgi:hypothetical protein